MKSKAKLCAGCNQPKIIWKNIGGKKYCQQCSIGVAKLDDRAKPAKAVPSRSSGIKRVSDKKAKLDIAYSVLRKRYLLDHPNCMARLPDCTLKSTDIHHMMGKVGLLYLDDTQFVALCRVCHQKIELSPDLAKALNLSKSRLKKNKL